eukprot:9357842-Alexandrium_andersonii.AAC.1
MARLSSEARELPPPARRDRPGERPAEAARARGRGLGPEDALGRLALGDLVETAAVLAPRLEGREFGPEVQDA